MIDGVVSTKGTTHTSTVAGSDGASMAVSAILNLEAGQQVSIALSNHTGTDDIDVDHATLTMIRVGNA
jgi:hypothetical protein